MKKIYHFFNAHQHHHTIPFIRKFQEINKNSKEFILIGNNKNGNYNELINEINSKIIFTDTTKLIIIMQKIFLEENSIIILHGFSYEFLIINRLAFYSKCSSRWVCWGAGLTKKEGFIGKIENSIKAWVYNSFNKINVLMKPDAEFLTSHGISKNKITTIPYPKITKTITEENPIKKIKLNVLIGNNSSKTNRHIELMRLLSAYPETIIEKIVVLFGYGGSNNEYKDEVNNYGASTFGEKFEMHHDMLSLDEYSLIMKKIDVVIIPGNRQTGLGAIYAGLENGSTIYVDKEGRNADWLLSLGIKFKFISELYTKNDLTISPENTKKNTLIYSNKFGQDNIKKMWENFISNNQNTCDLEDNN